MKNLRSLIMNGILVLVGVLGLVFMSQAFATSFGASLSGFKYMELSGAGLPTEIVLTKVSVIINIIVLSAMILVALVNILVVCGLIKSERVARILAITNIILAAIFLCANVMAMACLGSFYADTGVKLGWALILNLVLSGVALVVAALEKVMVKKN